MIFYELYVWHFFIGTFIISLLFIKLDIVQTIFTVYLCFKYFNNHMWTLHTYNTISDAGSLSHITIDIVYYSRLGGGPGHLSVRGPPPPPADPCVPTPCGPGTLCSVNRDGNPECRCVPGFTPAPDTITGCKPECEVDPDCRMGFVCRNFRCASKPDPCQPNPCGPGARCNVNPAGTRQQLYL